MQFAINYSPQAAALLQSGTIQIDRFKCPDWHDLVTEAETHAPVYIHFPLRVGNQSLQSVDFSAIEQWLSRTGTQYVNTHFSITRECYADADKDALVDLMLKEVMPLVAHFGAERVIIENIPLVPRLLKDYRIETVDPELISEVINTANCGFLFDISHAVLTCRTHGYDFEDYLSRLPMSRLRELHITGIGLDRQKRPADHLAMQTEDWQRLEWLLAEIITQGWRIPDMMAFEYGGIGPMFEWRSESDVIAAQVPRLYALTQQLNEKAMLS